MHLDYTVGTVNGMRLEAKAMDWNRGLKRITLVLSILAALVADVATVRVQMRGLVYAEDALAEERRAEYVEDVDVHQLLGEWKRADTFGGQNSIWLRWTSAGLPWWYHQLKLDEPADPNARHLEGPIVHPFPDTAWHQQHPIVVYAFPPPAIPSQPDIRLTPAHHEMPRLAEQGWCTVDGYSLPLTPHGVWYIRHCNEIRHLEKMVGDTWIVMVVSKAFALLFGFGIVWGIYGATRWGACPVCRWIVRGSREETRRAEDS